MSKHPRVVIDATPFLFTKGGVGRTTLRLVQELVRLDPPFDLRLVARSLRGALESPGIDLPVRRLRLPRSAEPWMRRLGLIERLVPGELYHATDHAMPLRNGDTSVATLHDLLFLIRPEDHMAEHHAWQRATVPEFAKRCRHILTCSDHSKGDIMEHLGIPADRITVAPWGIDREHFRPPADPSERERLSVQAPYFLAVSCSLGRKNTGRLLEAWQALGERRRDHHLVLVWSPPADAHPALALDSVHTTGRVDDAELVRWYGHARCTVFPSHYEGFGLPVLESMSCGTPVILSDRSSLPQVGGDAAHYINPDETESIVEALADAIEGRLDLDAMRQAGFDQCDHFSWERCAQTTLDVYQKAVAQ